MLDFRLSPAQEALRRKAREFALHEILPAAWEADRTGRTPVALLRKAREAGLMNADIPRAYGGEGLGLLDNVIITEELAAACAGLATSIFDNSLGMEPLRLCGNEPLKRRVFAELLADFKLIAFATSEPTMGSDVAGIRCLARRDGGDWVLEGTKFWVTNGGIADYFSIFATVDPKSRHEGICAFLVERSQPGVRVGRPIPKLGQRGSNTAGVRLEAVRVPAANVLAPPGEGFALAMRTFARTRPAIGAFAVGAARSAMEFAADYARRRQAFGTPIARFQAIQHKLADMFQKVETARLLVWKAAWEADQGGDPTIAASIAKLYASEAAFQVADEALQIFGGYGYTPLFPVEKILRDCRLFRIYEGTSEVQRHILAGHVLEAYRPVMPALEELALHRGGEASGTGATPRAWRCRICGHVHLGEQPPAECPVCFFPASAFREVHDP